MDLHGACIQNPVIRGLLLVWIVPGLEVAPVSIPSAGVPTRGSSTLGLRGGRGQSRRGGRFWHRLRCRFICWRFSICRFICFLWCRFFCLRWGLRWFLRWQCAAINGACRRGVGNIGSVTTDSVTDSADHKHNDDPEPPFFEYRFLHVYIFFRSLVRPPGRFLFYGPYQGIRPSRILSQ